MADHIMLTSWTSIAGFEVPAQLSYSSHTLAKSKVIRVNLLAVFINVFVSFEIRFR